MTTDNRPDPKPRKHSQLWQAYLAYDGLVREQTRHKLRLSSIEKEKSNLDADFEIDFIAALEPFIRYNQRIMIAAGKTLGPVWDWITTIRGMATGTIPARILAQIDDIAKFDTISKLWAFSGFAVRNGEIERCMPGQTAPYNRTLKSASLRAVDQFVRHNTPVYRELYDEEKERQIELYPDAICTKCGGIAVKTGQTWRCSECKQKNTNHALMYTDGHLDARAQRKVAKIFLQHVWLVWRQCEELPISQPWVIAHGGHVDYILPPNWPPESGTVKVLDEEPGGA